MRRTAMALCALVTAACLLGGCTYAAVTAARRSDTYLLYFREADLTAAAGGDALRSEETVLEGVDELEPEEAALALMEALLRGPTDETLRSAIPAGTEVESVQVEGRRAVVDMSAGYGSLSGVALTLADYAVTLTLTQLPGISSVSVTVRGRELGYRPSQLFTAGDVLFSSAEDVVGTVDADVYLLGPDGTLTAWQTTLELYEGDTQAAAVAAAVESGAPDQGLASPCPEGFAVRSVWQDQAVCYVNLSSAVLGELESTDGVPLALEALARSLCSLESVEEVQFLVDGEYADTYGPAAVRAPFTE
ncbi:GerMN domain-containing protein [uncultured Oscillibacter sp.]|uniref:GerMN domain-containing protein n=1 Tax=uncultured Oscillibacter sp. TaxID=876091 RepID=UPI0025E5EC8E|nr:GerMN domain-containing protein [uncultured Oscillibacter sp.]